MTRNPPLLRRLSPVARMALHLSLCLALVLVGAWSAASCAARTGLTEMVICSSTGGTEVVLLDGAGHAVPTSDATDCESCPVCLAAAGRAALPAPVFAFAATERLSDPLWITARATLPARPDPAPVARGPPGAAQDRMTA